MAMMPEISQVVVLVEDRRHQSFVRHFLRRLGYDRNVRYLPLPTACGEQWVRAQYRDLIISCRSRARGKKASTAAIVVIDADSQSVDFRLRQLDAVIQLEQGEVAVRLVPKRNIETWILCLSGNSVDEEVDYTRSNFAITPGDIASAASNFIEWSRLNATIPQQCVPSLSQALVEIRRIG